MKAKAKNKKYEILSEMVKTEKYMENLYKLYAERFKEDGEFWEKIMSEEGQHASLLSEGFLYLAFDMLPDTALINKLEDLKLTNESIKQITKAYEENMPPKNEAYNYAVQMEKGLSEAFFQELLKMKSAPDVVAAWQRLGEESVDHSKRIASLLS